MTNACPARYRNLRPRDECRLRSIRLGTDERPGGLPVMMQTRPLSRTNDEIRALILDAVASGVTNATRLCTVIGYPERTRRLIGEMTDAGELTVKADGQRWVYGLPDDPAWEALRKSRAANALMNGKE